MRVVPSRYFVLASWALCVFGKGTSHLIKNVTDEFHLSLKTDGQSSFC